MILDSLTIGVFAGELAAHHEGYHVRGAHADETGLDLLLETQPEGDSTANHLRLAFGPAGSLRLTPGGSVAGGDGRERYLQGARIERILPVPGERVLTLRLSRRDAESNLTYALFHLVLIPPRYHAVLVSESHGRILGVWATSKDRRAPAHGTPYEAPATPVGGLVPGRDTPEVFFDRLRAQDRAVKDAVRTILSGADRHLVARICTDSGVCPTTHTDSVTELVSAAMWSTAQHLWSIGGGPVYRWTRGQTRISIVAPDSQMEALQFPSVCAALADAGETAADAAADMNGQRRRLEYVRRVLERRAADLQKDLDEADDVDLLDRVANSLMAATDHIAAGTKGVIPDVHDAHGEATLEIELAPGVTAAQHAARLLRRAAKLRRRANVLPPRLHRVRELIFETEQLLDALLDEDTIAEEVMTRWERRVEVRQSAAVEVRQGAALPGETAGGTGGSTEGRHGAHPRRYLTSTGWSVWAGRNNRENDIVTHRLAAQNDVWFHAHGYAGSHVILRREGRKQEPSRQTLEEAAAVAAYWSKGRTANKVPVVYTLAKYVSKPKGAVPGLAVMKRERTIMARPALLAEEERQT